MFPFHLMPYVRHPTFNRRSPKDVREGMCYACGKQTAFDFSEIINDILTEQWGITEKIREAFHARESLFCQNCGCSLRLRRLAQAIVLVHTGQNISLRQAIEQGDLKQLRIAEINSCGKLHEILTLHDSLTYSEYGSADPMVKHQDLQALTYPDNQFDLVLTSDTLEHVPLYQKALQEIWRILKPGGYHIFTAPTVIGRPTRHRAEQTTEGIKDLLPPSYHGSGEPDYLVFHEFGFDFIRDIQTTRFTVRLFFANILDTNDANFVFVTRKGMQ